MARGAVTTAATADRALANTISDSADWCGKPVAGTAVLADGSFPVMEYQQLNTMRG